VQRQTFTTGWLSSEVWQIDQAMPATVAGMA
jgi:hypothetical protein